MKTTKRERKPQKKKTQYKSDIKKKQINLGYKQK